VAAVSIAGTCLDVIGSLYLAYDLLGGQHGALRLLTRAVTYSIVFGVGYGLGLGLLFGLASGVATGVTIAIELNRAARWAGPLFAGVGRIFQRDTKRRLRRCPLPESGVGICCGLCRAAYGGTSVCLFSRHAAGA
jgi:hypothetical protein